MNVIIPTRNDYCYLENIIKELSEIKEINKIIIVNNASHNKITRIIKRISLISPKCLYLECKEIGKGKAIRRGLEKISKDPEDVIFVDADIANFNKNMILLLIDALKNGSDLVKANFITKQWPIKEELMKCYGSQLNDIEYQKTRSLNEYRGSAIGVKYAEGFKTNRFMPIRMDKILFKN